jgi:hypothetical protein
MEHVLVAAAAVAAEGSAKQVTALGPDVVQACMYMCIPWCGIMRC